MAEGQRMTAAAVEKLLSSEHADVIRESVRLVVAELMEAEVAEMVGAELGERAPERRSTQRNGYRERWWETRVGELELAIPRLRSGPAYFPSFLEPRRRAEQALVAVVQEAAATAGPPRTMGARRRAPQGGECRKGARRRDRGYAVTTSGRAHDGSPTPGDDIRVR